MTPRVNFPERVPLTDSHEAHVARFSGIGGRWVRVFPVGGNEPVRQFKVRGDRDVAINNARECARVLEES